MRLSAFAWCCLVAAFCTACVSDAGGRSGPGPTTGVTSLESKQVRLADVASRITVALAEVCDCGAAADSDGTATELCGYPVKIENLAELHASTNGHRIRITSGMLRYFASDDELAFVLAHELSHILLGHAGAFNGLSSKAVEVEADRLGIQIVSAADFDTELAAKFPERLAQSYPSMSRLAGAYPMPAKRTAMIRSALRKDAGRLAAVGLRRDCAN